MPSSSSSNGQHDDDRPEDLLLHDLHVEAATGEQRRRDVVTGVGLLRARAAGHDLGAFGAPGFDVALDPVAVRGGDDRAEHGVGLVRVADLQHVRHLGEALDDLVVHAPLHDRARRRGADLAGVERPRRADHADRGLQVRVVVDERAALAAELEQQALHRAAADLADAHADAGRTGERDHVDVARRDERLAGDRESSRSRR